MRLQNTHKHYLYPGIANLPLDPLLRPNNITKDIEGFCSTTKYSHISQSYSHLINLFQECRYEELITFISESLRYVLRQELKSYGYSQYSNSSFSALLDIAIHLGIINSSCFFGIDKIFGFATNGRKNFEYCSNHSVTQIEKKYIEPQNKYSQIFKSKSDRADAIDVIKVLTMILKDLSEHFSDYRYEPLLTQLLEDKTFL